MPSSADLVELDVVVLDRRVQPVGDLRQEDFRIRGDELSVVRLSSRSDEAFGDYGTARDRIAGYRGGIVPFSSRDTPETVLKAVTKIARQLEPIEHRRKGIICVGLGSVCDVEEPSLGGNSVLWPR